MKIEIGYFEMFDGNFPFGLRGIYLFLPNNFFSLEDFGGGRKVLQFAAQAL